MENPATRLLAVAHLLHTHQVVSAETLAARLGISTRSVRRYVALLRDLGVQIDTAYGNEGGYTLVTTRRLPPTIFSAPELALMRQALSAVAWSGTDRAAVSALIDKLDRLMGR